VTGRLAEQWATYRERVVPPTAGQLQVQESRRAFYAGAEAFFRVCMRGLEPGTEPTEEDFGLMEALDAELREFARDVAEGRA